MGPALCSEQREDSLRFVRRSVVFSVKVSVGLVSPPLSDRSTIGRSCLVAVSLISGLGACGSKTTWSVGLECLRYLVIGCGRVSRRPRSDLPRGESYAPERVIDQKLKRQPARRADRSPGP